MDSKESVFVIDSFTVKEYNKTNIYIIEDILSVFFCEKIIKLINTIELQKHVYYSGNNVECYLSTIDSLLKLSETSYYTFSTDPCEIEKLLNISINDSVSTNKLNGLTHKDIQNNLDEINKVMIQISSIMEKVNNKIKFEFNSGYCLRKIYGKTRNHIDNISEVYNSEITFIKNNKMGDYKMVRNASIVFSLNDDYEGGEFMFPYQDITVKLKKGSVVIFPPFWTHPHETNDLINNTFRYTINTWSCEKIN